MEGKGLPSTTTHASHRVRWALGNVCRRISSHERGPRARESGQIHVSHADTYASKPLRQERGMTPHTLTSTVKRLNRQGEAEIWDRGVCQARAGAMKPSLLRTYYSGSRIDAPGDTLHRDGYERRHRRENGTLRCAGAQHIDLGGYLRSP